MSLPSRSKIKFAQKEVRCPCHQGQRSSLKVNVIYWGQQVKVVRWNFLLLSTCRGFDWCSKSCVWHMFSGKGLWWVMQTNRFTGFGWNTVRVSIDRVDLCQTHCNRCLTFPALQEVTWSRGQVLAYRKCCYILLGSKRESRPAILLMMARQSTRT